MAIAKNRFTYVEREEEPIAECAYSGDPIYSWDSCVEFENGVITLEDYWIDYAISRGIIKRIMGEMINGRP